MCDNSNSNPFAALFTSANDGASFTSQSQGDNNKSDENVNINDNCGEDIEDDEKDEDLGHDLHSDKYEGDERLDELIADVFGITLHSEKKKKPTRQLVFIDIESVQQAIFERLLLANPESSLISKESTKGQELDRHVVQTEIIPYLFESYCRLQRYADCDGSQDTVQRIRKIIVCDVSTALQAPALFLQQQVCINV